MAHLRHLLDRIPWWLLEPGQELIDSTGLLMQQANEWYLRTPCCAAAAGELYIVYYPATTGRRKKTLRLEPNVDYVAQWFSPISGDTRDVPVDDMAVDGVWPVPRSPDPQDWVLVVRNAGGRVVDL